jgi:tetratricopeptide (TPR) repeat protein
VPATGRSALLRGQMLSKSGRFAEAIAVAEQFANAQPSSESAVAAAMAHKRAGDIEACVAWFLKAAELDPTDEAGLLDIGDIRLGQERYQDAIAVYEEAVRRKPKHDWAEPSILYCRYQLTKDAAPLEELRYMANAGPCDCGVADALQQMFGGYTYEDRRRRAEWLMQLAEPGFVPTHRPHEHHHDEEE